MRTQGLNPAAFPDPLLARTFGAAISGAGFVRVDGSDTDLKATTVAGAPTVLEVTLQTVEACPDEAAFLKALAATVSAEAARGDLRAKDDAHNELWAELWGRSHVDISVAPDDRSSRPKSKIAAGADRSDTMDPTNVEVCI